MSSPTYRASLAPRIVVLLGAVAMVASNFVKGDDTLKAVLQLGGGVVALAGLVWFLLVMRRARSGRG